MKTLLSLAAVASVLSAQVRLPNYTRTPLPNGIVLNVMPRTDVPLVTVRIVVKGGVEAEPENLSGLASATAEALRRGTSKRTASEFSEQLDALGATFSANAGPQSTTITSEFLAKDLEAGLDLVLDAVLRPTFPEAEIKKLLAQRIDEAKSVKDEPDRAVALYYNRFLFGPKHPYGRPADELSLARITRQAIAGHHKQMFVSRNMIVVIAGDVDAAATTKRLAALLSAVPEGPAYAWKKIAPLSAGSTRVAVVDKPDATQTRFMIGMPGTDRMNPDRIPLWVVNTFFGDRFTSVLNDELRVNTGLTYGARSHFDQNRLPGALTVSTFTRTETTGKALDMAVSLLGRLREKGITAEQLQSTKNYIKGVFPSDRLETPDQLAQVLTEIELFELNRGEVDDLFSRIDAVTVEKANEIARKYYRDSNLALLLLGNAEQFIGDLKKYSPEIVRVPITAPGIAIQ